MTSTADPEYTPAYQFDNQWRAARERLSLLETCCDPLTQGNLDRVGIKPGWHCLEVGAGGGSVARMLCERVGAEGRVLAVDLEPALLDELAGPNLDVQRLDVVADELPEAEFDLIHTRAVLMHIPQRDTVLPKLVRALRPGGVLLLEEMDVTPAYAMPDCLYLQAIHAAWDRMAEGGVDIFWGGKTRGLLEAAGLDDVGGHSDRCTFSGGEPMATFFRISWAQLLEGRPFSDEERAVVLAGSDLIDQPGGEYIAWDFVAAWGRRPHENQERQP